MKDALKDSRFLILHCIPVLPPKHPSAEGAAVHVQISNHGNWKEAR